MKNPLLVGILVLMFGINSFAQINPFLGIFDVDSCNFNTVCNQITIDTSGANIWQIGLPSKPFFDTAYSAPNAIMTDSVQPYDTLNHSFFDVSFPNGYGFGMILSFKHKYQTDTLVDGGYIEVSYDKGANWYNVIYDDTINISGGIFHVENMYSKTDTISGGIPAFHGTSTDWINTQIQWVWAWPIRSFIPDTLMFRFHFVSDSIQNNLAGWIIDDIKQSYAYLGGGNEADQKRNVYSLFPNPATTHFEISDAFSGALRLFNSIGEIVMRKEINTGDKINVEGLAAGIYHYELSNAFIGKQNVTGKILIE